MWTAEQRERYKDDGRRYPSDLTDPFTPPLLSWASDWVGSPG